MKVSTNLNCSECGIYIVDASVENNKEARDTWKCAACEEKKDKPIKISGMECIECGEELPSFSLDLGEQHDLVCDKCKQDKLFAALKTIIQKPAEYIVVNINITDDDEDEFGAFTSEPTKAKEPEKVFTRENFLAAENELLKAEISLLKNELFQLKSELLMERNKNFQRGTFEPIVPPYIQPWKLDPPIDYPTYPKIWYSITA